MDQNWDHAKILNGEKRWKQKLSSGSQWCRGPLAICTFLINGDPKLNTELQLTGKHCGESMGLHEFLVLQIYRNGALLICKQTRWVHQVIDSAGMLNTAAKEMLVEEVQVEKEGSRKIREIICKKIVYFLRDIAYSRLILCMYGWWVIVGQQAIAVHVSWDTCAQRCVVGCCGHLCLCWKAQQD